MELVEPGEKVGGQVVGAHYGQHTLRERESVGCRVSAVGFRMQGTGCIVKGAVWGVECRVQGVGWRVHGVGCGRKAHLARRSEARSSDLRSRVEGLEFLV